MIRQASFHFMEEDKVEVNVRQYNDFATISFDTDTEIGFINLYMRSLEDIKNLSEKLQFAIQALEMEGKQMYYPTIWDALFLFGFPIATMIILYEIKQFIKRKFSK